MNKLVRRIRRTTVREKNKLKRVGKDSDNENSKMDVCFAEDSSDSGFDAESRIQMLSRRNSASSAIFDRGSNDLDRDSSDDSIDSGIFGVSSADELNSSDASNADARITLVEDSGLANLLCQSISINEDDVNALQYCDDNANEPPNKRRCIFPATKVVTEKVSDMQIEMCGSTSEIHLYGIAHQADRPQLTAYRSSSSGKNTLSSNQNLNSRRKLNRKPPSLHATFPSRVKDGQIDLRIISQPEEQHRARYMTEGSRGAIKDRRGSGFPTVKLFGYNQPVTLQVFIGSDQGKIQPHLFYQACKVSGKNCTPCTERIIDGTTVIEISMLPDKDMTVSCDCIGILKERNVDVEQRLPYFNMTRAKKKNTRCRMIFRVNLPLPESGIDTLQAASSAILCTQPPGVPEISKKSIKECSVLGGTELFIIGKNFLKDTKILFEQESHDTENDMNKIWQEIVEPEKEFLHQTHLVCRVPPYRRQNIMEPVKVHLTVQSGGKTSEPHTFIYQPVKQGLDNVTGNFQTIASGIPGTLGVSQQLSRSQLMPAFIQVPAPLTTSVPTVVVSQASNFIAFPRGSVPDPTIKSVMTPKLVQAPSKVIRTALSNSKVPDENGNNSNQIHVVVLQQSEKNMKRAHQLSAGNRFRGSRYPGKQLHRFNHKGKLLAISKGKHCTNHPYHSGAQTPVNQLLTSTTPTSTVFKQAMISGINQLPVDTISEIGAIPTAIVSQDGNTATVQGFATEMTPTTMQSTDLFAVGSVIPSVNEIQDSQSCLPTALAANGVPVQAMVGQNEVSIASQSVIQSNMISAAEMQSMITNGSNLLQSQSALLSPNDLIQSNEPLLNQQNELIQNQLDQSIIINRDANNSISTAGELTTNECQSIQLKEQLSNNEICLSIAQNEISGLCTTIIDNKQLPNESIVVTSESVLSDIDLNRHSLKQEIDSKEFLQPQPVMLGLPNAEMDQSLNGVLKNDLMRPISSPVINQSMSQSPNFIAIHSQEPSQNCINGTMLHVSPMQLQSEQILGLSPNAVVNNCDPELTLSQNLTVTTTSPLIHPLKVEPLLSQVAQMNSPNPLVTTSYLQTSASPQPPQFVGMGVKQEKPNSTQAQCDMNMFQHTMTNALSMLSESDLLSLINPSTFDNL